MHMESSANNTNTYRGMYEIFWLILVYSTNNTMNIHLPDCDETGILFNLFLIFNVYICIFYGDFKLL